MTLKKKKTEKQKQQKEKIKINFTHITDHSKYKLCNHTVKMEDREYKNIYLKWQTDTY